MLKYLNAEVTFAEIPDEITLCINITGCPNRCKGCHSPFLWEDIGKVLTIEELDKLVQSNSGVSCICFMGGDADSSYINYLANYIKHTYSKLKVAWYSGKSTINQAINLDNFNYIKLGPYKEELGGLDQKITNQHLYKVNDSSLEDITYKFWK